jgi:hypothetical protein
MTTGTDLSGLYQFGDLSAGTYTVTFTVPAGFGLSTPGVLSVTLTQQSPSAEADAGLIPPGEHRKPRIGHDPHSGQRE